jgi:RNA polymerase sigma factor (sigma-70 family)
LYSIGNLALITAYNKFVGAGVIEAYLCQHIRFDILDELRKESDNYYTDRLNKCVGDSEVELFYLIEDPSPGVDKVIDKLNYDKRLRGLVEELPELQRNIIKLWAYEDKPPEEICLELGISIGVLLADKKKAYTTLWGELISS